MEKKIIKGVSIGMQGNSAHDVEVCDKVLKGYAEKEKMRTFLKITCPRSIKTSKNHKTITKLLKSFSIFINYAGMIIIQGIERKKMCQLDLKISKKTLANLEYH